MKNKPENNTTKYIATTPKEAQTVLKELRAIIREVAPTATERTDYFQIPGYSLDQYNYYHGMFVWFSFKKPYIRLHILPSVIEKYAIELEKYKLTKSIIGFKVSDKIPKSLVKKLVKESSKAMKMLSRIKK